MKQSQAFRMCESYRRKVDLIWEDVQACKKKIETMGEEGEKGVYIPTYQVFKAADLNDDMVLNHDEWIGWNAFHKCQSFTDRVGLSRNEVQTCEPNATPNAIQKLFNASDKNDDGVLMFEEWKEWVLPGRPI